jgi:glutaredoxin 2
MEALDLFDFSVNGIVTQAMSVTKTYTTSTLKASKLVISAESINKSIIEDNVQSASVLQALYYINGIKISPTEKELVFGLPGNGKW